jgi:hypothetical protein
MAYAKQGPCGEDQAKVALDQADTFRDWDSLYKSQAEYGNCDDGAVGEGYSESVARILVDHWDTLPRLADLGKTNPGFQAFVIKHVDASLNNDDVKKIKENAKLRCPKGLSGLCDDLKKQAH